MVLLPEIVGKKSFLESTSPTFQDRLVEKRMCEDRFEGPGWKQKAEACSGSSNLDVPQLTFFGPHGVLLSMNTHDWPTCMQTYRMKPISDSLA
ncbi:hypothetical protein TNCV_852291 [Trichonephila clavipes]|nr:hypothetical protein TNCV_852291 [Trichonephila clavipes]